MSKSLSKNKLNKLVDDISNIYLSHQQKLEAATNKILLSAYWEIGRRIVEEEQGGSSRAEYGSKLLLRISEGLIELHGEGFSPRNLSNMRKLFLNYPILQAAAKLEWTHYCLLLGIKDEKKRDFYRKLAIKEEMSTPELKIALKKDKVECNSLFFDENEGQIPKKIVKLDEKRVILPQRRGSMNIYKQLELDDDEKGDGFAAIDVGFFVDVVIELKGAKVPAFGKYFESQKTEDGYVFKVTALRKRPYVYKARVKRVVDGDTLVCRVDLGFRTFRTVRFRLAYIDCPEIGTSEGIAARDFVVEELKGLDFVMIHSVGLDMYGRDLAEVFYSPKSHDPKWVINKGLYLNQEILDAGHAVPMM